MIQESVKTMVHGAEQNLYVVSFIVLPDVELYVHLFLYTSEPYEMLHDIQKSLCILIIVINFYYVFLRSLISTWFLWNGHYPSKWVLDC